jgi:hypothetical protein
VVGKVLFRLNLSRFHRLAEERVQETNFFHRSVTNIERLESRKCRQGIKSTYAKTCESITKSIKDFICRLELPRAGSPAWLRRRPHVAKIAGSNPARPTNILRELTTPVASFYHSNPNLTDHVLQVA